VENFNVNDTCTSDTNTSTCHAGLELRRQDLRNSVAGVEGEQHGAAMTVNGKEGKKRGRGEKDAGSTSSKLKAKAKAASPGGDMKEGQSLMTRFFRTAPARAVVGGGEVEQG
jgi:hypothetical protein